LDPREKGKKGKTNPEDIPARERKREGANDRKSCEKIGKILQREVAPFLGKKGARCYPGEVGAKKKGITKPEWRPLPFSKRQKLTKAF